MRVAFHVSIAAAVLASPSAQVRAQAPADYTKYNVCEVVPGEAIARAIGAKLIATRPTFDKKWSRCRYVVAASRPDEQLGVLVWLSPVADFEEIKPFIAEKITPVAGLGDGAYIFQDKGDGRFKIYVLLRGQQTIQATGDTPELARKIAETAVAALRKKPA
jgi:hypothetical protein